MNTATLRRTSSRLLLAVGYVAMTFEWLWIIVVGLPPLMKSGAFDWLTAQPEQSPVMTLPAIEPSPVLIVVVMVTTVVILAVSTITLLKLPGTLLQGGDTVVNQVAHKVLPVVSHHTHLPAKKRRVLTRRLRLFVQILICAVGLGIALALPETSELSRSLIVLTAVFLAGVASLCFAAAWLIEPGTATSRTRSRASRG